MVLDIAALKTVVNTVRAHKDFITRIQIHFTHVNSTVVPVVFLSPMTHHTAACVKMDFIISKIEPICHVVCSILQVYKFIKFLVHNLIPSFTENYIRYCSISGDNGTLIYETPNSYRNYAYCHAEFSCPKGYALEYEFTRFGIEQDYTCGYDHLGILFIHNLYNIIYLK